MNAVVKSIRDFVLLRFTVKQSFVVIGAVATLALLTVIGVSYNAVYQSREASQSADSRQKNAMLVSNMQESLLVALAVTSQFAGDTTSEEEFKKVSSESYAFLREQMGLIGQRLNTADEQALFDGLLPEFTESDQKLQALYADFDLDLYQTFLGHIRVVRDGLETLVVSFEAAQTEAMAVREAWLDRSVDHALIAGCGAIVFILPLLLFVARGVVRPIDDMTATMRELVDENLDVDVPCRDRTDELGEMAGAVQVFKDNAVRMRTMRNDQEEAERRAQEEKRRALNELADEFEANVKAIVDAVSSAAGQMQATAQSMTSTADDTSNRSAAATAASHEATGHVNSVASAAEELSNSITEISRQVGDSAKIAVNAVAEAERTNKTVTGLNDAAQKIGDVVHLINDIASQTNLLALNATIEAARAGDAGKGFAVVASEVKNLATQTAKATDEIGAQITAMQEETSGAVRAIKSIGDTIGQISEISTAISSAVEQQGAATSEISRNVQEAAQGTQEVSATIGGVSESVSQTGSAAGDMLTAAADLSQRSSVLHDQVETFLEHIRAA